MRHQNLKPHAADAASTATFFIIMKHIFFALLHSSLVFSASFGWGIKYFDIDDQSGKLIAIPSPIKPSNHPLRNRLESSDTQLPSRTSHGSPDEPPFDLHAPHQRTLPPSILRTSNTREKTRKQVIFSADYGVRVIPRYHNLLNLPRNRPQRVPRSTVLPGELPAPYQGPYRAPFSGSDPDSPPIQHAQSILKITKSDKNTEKHVTFSTDLGIRLIPQRKNHQIHKTKELNW